MFRISTIHMLALLLVVALVPAGSQGAAVVEMAPPGTNFDELPYADWLNGGGNRLNISIEVGYVRCVAVCPDLSGFRRGPLRVACIL